MPFAAALVALMAVSMQVAIVLGERTRTAQLSSRQGSPSRHGLAAGAVPGLERLRTAAQVSHQRTEEFRRLVEEKEASSLEPDRRAWKWAIRSRVWDYMEVNNITAPPYPAHNRAPNFRGFKVANERILELEEFRSARVVMVSSGAQLGRLRALALDAGKKLLMPPPGLRQGFILMDPSDCGPSIKFASTQGGMEKFGRPISEEDEIQVDLVVVGSVAVNPWSGARISRGVGLGDLEYAMLMEMGAIHESTPVVTVVHDCQLAEDIEAERMLVYDVPADVICTPTQTLRTHWPLFRPTGIFWDKVSPERLESVELLKEMKVKREKELGRSVKLAPSELLPPSALRTENYHFGAHRYRGVRRFGPKRRSSRAGRKKRDAMQGAD